jgi:hypothetical protein
MLACCVFVKVYPVHAKSISQDVSTQVFLEATPVAIIQTCCEARCAGLRSYTKIYQKG